MLCLCLVFLLYIPVNMVLAYVLSFTFSKYQTCQSVLPPLMIWVSGNTLSQASVNGLHKILSKAAYISTFTFSSTDCMFSIKRQTKLKKVGDFLAE